MFLFSSFLPFPTKLIFPFVMMYQRESLLLKFSLNFVSPSFFPCSSSTCNYGPNDHWSNYFLSLNLLNAIYILFSLRVLFFPSNHFSTATSLLTAVMNTSSSLNHPRLAISNNNLQMSSHLFSAVSATVLPHLKMCPWFGKSLLQLSMPRPSFSSYSVARPSLSSFFRLSIFDI